MLRSPHFVVSPNLVGYVHLIRFFRVLSVVDMVFLTCPTYWILFRVFLF